jgi:hypothetical protein
VVGRRVDLDVGVVARVAVGVGEAGAVVAEVLAVEQGPVGLVKAQPRVVVEGESVAVVVGIDRGFDAVVTPALGQQAGVGRRIVFEVLVEPGARVPVDDVRAAE